MSEVNDLTVEEALAPDVSGNQQGPQNRLMSRLQQLDQSWRSLQDGLKGKQAKKARAFEELWQSFKTDMERESKKAGPTSMRKEAAPPKEPLISPEEAELLQKMFQEEAENGLFAPENRFVPIIPFVAVLVVATVLALIVF